MEEILLVAVAIVLVVLWFALKWLVIGVWTAIRSAWNGLTGETARRKKREDDARRAEEECQQRERERQRERRQAKQRQQQRFRTENSTIFAGITYLLSTCRAPVEEMIRAVRAIEGESMEVEPKTQIWTDIGFILASFSKTGGMDGAYIETLWSEVTREIEPPHIDGVPALSHFTNRGVKQLGLIVLLKEYDRLQSTILSSQAASTYLGIVSAVRTRCDGSLSAKIVADEYFRLLSPYIQDEGGSGYATNSSPSTSSPKSVCTKCAKYFAVLGLALGVSEAEVRQKRRAWAEVLHPDQLSSKSDKARDVAEQQLKGINEACDRILTCPCRAKVRSNATEGEPPQAPHHSHQSTSEATAKKTTAHQPSSASSSTEGKEEMRKHGYKVRSEQDLIDAIDGTRRKVDESTRRIQEFVEQLKNRGRP
jgi:hypothetical protein